MSGSGTGKVSCWLSVAKCRLASDKFPSLSCQPPIWPLYSPGDTMSTPAQFPFVFIGNHRVLDFVNTEVAADGALRDLLGGFGDLVQWLEAAGALDRASARMALAKWEGKR